MKKLLKKFCILNNCAMLKDITNNICEVEDMDDKYICYVKGDNLIRKFRGEYCYRFYLYGVDNYNNNILNKPIYYVFSDIVFDKELFVVSFFDVRIIFRNCTFGKGIRLLGVNEVIFENNTYCYYHGINNFLYGYGKSLKFINDNIYNNRYYFNQMGINVNFDKVEIVNTNIEIEEVSCFRRIDNDMQKFLSGGEIFISSRELVISESVIRCPSIYFDCDILKGNNKNLIEANKGIMIDTKSNYFNLRNIVSPYIVMNGDLYVGDKDEYNELFNNRKYLINQLRAIVNYFNDINMKEVKEVECEIKSRNIGKILKK